MATNQRVSLLIGLWPDRAPTKMATKHQVQERHHVTWFAKEKRLRRCPQRPKLLQTKKAKGSKRKQNGSKQRWSSTEHLRLRRYPREGPTSALETTAKPQSKLPPPYCVLAMRASVDVDPRPRAETTARKSTRQPWNHLRQSRVIFPCSLTCSRLVVR